MCVNIHEKLHEYIRIVTYNGYLSDAGSSLSLLMPDVLKSIPLRFRFSFRSCFHLCHFFRSKMNKVKEELRKLGISSESNSQRLDNLGLEVSSAS